VASKNVSVGEAHKNWRCKYFDKAEKQKQNIEINIISFALRFFICTRVSFCGGKIILFAKFLFSCQPPKNPFRNSEICTINRRRIKINANYELVCPSTGDICLSFCLIAALVMRKIN